MTRDRNDDNFISDEMKLHVNAALETQDIPVFHSDLNNIRKYPTSLMKSWFCWLWGVAEWQKKSYYLHKNCFIEYQWNGLQFFAEVTWLVNIL